MRSKKRRLLRLAGGEMKGRKREGGRDKGRGREKARVRWIGIGGDCVMFERRRRDCREWRERKVVERREEGRLRIQGQKNKKKRWVEGREEGAAGTVKKAKR